MGVGYCAPGLAARSSTRRRSDRKRIAAAVEVKRAVPGRASNNPAVLEDHERNTAGIGLCAVETDAKQRDQRDQGASQQDRNSHGNFRLQSLRHGRERFPSVHLTRREMTWLIPPNQSPLTPP